MATYLFRKKVDDFTAMGVNFKEHSYVPEKSPDTGKFFQTVIACSKACVILREFSNMTCSVDTYSCTHCHS